jgi:hypothetical protein
VRDALFITSNFVIFLGYCFLAVFVVPMAAVRLWVTRIGGMLFFLLCGLHHLENVAHLVYTPEQRASEVYTSVHMLLIDVPQAGAVWAFVIGLYLEAVKWGPWSAGNRHSGSLTTTAK